MVTFLDGGDPVISGSEALTKPGGYQFTATGGNEPYTWSVAGTGVTINSSTGYVTMGDGACGSFYVTCTDCTGRSVSHGGTRVTNSGSWQEIGYCTGSFKAPCLKGSCWWDADAIIGVFRYRRSFCLTYLVGGSCYGDCMNYVGTYCDGYLSGYVGPYGGGYCQWIEGGDKDAWLC